MSSPLAHAIAGAGVMLLGIGPGRDLRDPRTALAAIAGAALAIAPDFDFVPVVLFGLDQRTVHRTATHSLTLAIVVAALVAPALACRLELARWRVAALAFAAYASHMLLDLLCPDHLPPVGVELFWPFSKTYVPPFEILPEVDLRYAWENRTLWPILETLTLEALEVGTVVILLLAIQRGMTHRFGRTGLTVTAKVPVLPDAGTTP